MWHNLVGRTEATRRATWDTTTKDEREWDLVWLLSFSNLSPRTHTQGNGFFCLLPPWEKQRTTWGEGRRGNRPWERREKRGSAREEKGEEGISHGSLYAKGGAGLA